MNRKKRVWCKRQKCVEQLERRRLLTTYYVDNNAGDNGANTNPGLSLSAPFLTIQEAANVAKPGDTVDIVAGTYREQVVPAHSGTVAAPITYQPYNNGDVVVSGANLLSGWNQYSGNIYQSAAMNWTMGGQDDQIYVDGQLMNYARWPNTSLNVSSPNWELTGANTTGTINADGSITNVVYDPNLTQPTGYWNGATIHIESGETWIYEAAKISNYTLTTINGTAYGVITYTASYTGSNYYTAVQGDPYYITGDPYFSGGQFQNLDSAGEFYRDPNSGSLYLWTPFSDSPAAHVVEAKAREWAFDLSGLSYINITGVNIFAAGINSSSTSSHLLLNGITAQYVSGFENYTGNWTPTLLNGMNVIGGTGIVLDGGFDTLENSTIAYSAGEGVFLGGSNNTIYDNVIHDVDYAGLNAAAITTLEYSTTLSSNDNISFNTLYNGARTLIEASSITASHIDNNLIYNAMLQTADGGAIYSFAGNGNGTEINNNVIYNSENNVPGYSACGIFLDASSTGFTLDHNVIYNTTEGIKFYQTYANNVLNNTIDNSNTSIELSSQTATGNVANNVTTSTIYLPFGTVGMAISNNLQPPTDPQFVSESTGNYQLLSTSPAINAGTVVSPYTNGYLGSAPDLGAYEFGATPWSYGATAAATSPAFDPVPAPWTASDIGAPAVAGTSTYSSGVFNVSGAGDDIWNSADQFQFVDTAVTGDQTIVARLTSQPNTNTWAKAGVMFRSTTAANSPFAMVVQTPGNGVNFMWRDGSGNLGYVTAAAVANPVWLKLVRSGTTFTAYDSVDGSNWNNIDTITMPLAASGLMGLAVCSHNTAQICTATFDNVSLQIQSPSGLTATSVTTSTINLNWSATVGASGYQIQRSTNGINFSTITSIGAVTSYTDPGLSAGTQYYYRIVAVGSLGSSSASSIVSASTLTLAPSAVSAVASAIQTSISWTAVTGPVSYNIYRGTTTGGEAATPIATGITGLTYGDTNVRTGVIYYYCVTAVNLNTPPLNTESARSSEVSVSAGVVSTVPATILAVNYDLGGQGVAYNSSSTTNPGGVYRNDGIDIQATTANGGGYYVGNVLPGEWLNYTISVPTTGYYSFNTLVASAATGGTFHIDIDGANVSAALTVPNTGNAQTYSTVITGPVQMTAGRHVMQLDFDTAPGGQVGNFFSVAIATAPAPTPAVPAGLTATAGVGAISLAWTGGSFDTTFNVYRSTTAGGEGTAPLATGITATNYTDATAVVGTKYYYTATGVFGSKISAASNEASATSVVTLVLDSSFEQTSVNGTYVYDPITPNWKFTGNAGIEANGSALGAVAAPNGTQAAFLQLVSQTSGGSFAQTEAFASAGRFDFTFDAAQRASFGIEPIVVSVDGSVLTTISPTSTTFQIYATPAITLSAGSHVLSFATTSTAPVGATSFIDLVTTAVLPPAPNPPTAVSATPGLSLITLAWTAPTGSVTYNVYRGTAAGGESATPLVTGLTANSYTDTTAVTGTTYFYTVTAVSSQNLQSSASTEVSATITIVKITGTTIGTSTSWLNNGDTIAQVFDGNLNTYFDAPNSSLTNWVGLDMGTARTVTQIQYAPRAGFEYRMYGGQFQVSNSANFSSGVVTLYTINAIPTAGKLTSVLVNPGAAYRYVRFVGGSQWVNIAEVQVDGLATTIVQTPHQLTGTPIGTQPSFLNNGDTIAQAFDGNLNTYFDAPNSSLTNWVGLDLGSPATITQIAFAPRAGYEFRMYGGQFQVSTTADFSSSVLTVYTVTSIPVAGQLTTVNVNVPSQYRYIRFIGGTQWVNIAEMQVIGTH